MYDLEIEKLNQRLAEIDILLSQPGVDTFALKNEQNEINKKIIYLKLKEHEQLTKEAYYEAKDNWEKAKDNLKNASAIGESAIDNYKSAINSYDSQRKSTAVLGILGVIGFVYLMSKKGKRI